jgi:DNA-binding beta-propeller fold protein YncE
MRLGATSPRQPRHRQLLASMLGAVAIVVVTSAAPASAAVSPATSVNVALAPTAVAVDAAAHTAYVAVSNGVVDQVAVVDTAKCTAHASAACAAAVSAVTLKPGAGVAGLAFDAANHTVYVADSKTGDVSMINSDTCNATNTASCRHAPFVAALGLAAPSAIAVDTSGGKDVFYVADSSAGTVTVFNGASCRVSSTYDCATRRTATVGAGPDAVAVDSAAGTVYVANRDGNSLSTLNEAACSKLTAACATSGRTVPLGAEAAPVALVADPAVNTVFVADSGTGTVSFLNTLRCTIAATVGCSTTPRTMAGLGAAGIALTSEGDVAVADATHNRVVVFGAATCDATTTTGCFSAERDPLHGSPTALATNGVTIYAADPSHTSLEIVATPSITVKVKSAHAESKFGWYRSPITVRFVCTAGTGSLTASCPVSKKVTKNTRGVSFAATLTSADGGRVTTSVQVKLDTTKPTIKVTGVVNGKIYAKHRHPTLHCKAADALSGVVSCSIARKHHGPHGRIVDYIGTAKDKAGNVHRISGTFKLS